METEMKLQMVHQGNDTLFTENERTSQTTEEVEFDDVTTNHQKTIERRFIEANTNPVSLFHLKNDCIIPVFRDNEKTISHYEFVDALEFSTRHFFKGAEVLTPAIRVSHQINGRIPSALHKKVSELEDWEKTRYYERMMFIIEIPSITEDVNGNKLNLTVGGVRALNHESLFSKKSIEKFKVFVGFQNLVCTNLLISTDGVALDIRVSSYDDLIRAVLELLSQYSGVKQLNTMRNFGNYSLTEHQFAQVIGKSRLYQHLPSAQKKEIPPLDFNDGQINAIARDYYLDKSFCRLDNGNIDLWRLYGLFTGSNKSSYIDSFLDRSVNGFSFTQGLVEALEKGNPTHWFLS
jgi:hypothetical protein